jgi:hypothetical protein
MAHIPESAPTSLRHYRAQDNSWEQAAGRYNYDCLLTDGSHLYAGNYGGVYATAKGGSLGVSILDFQSNQWNEIKAKDELPSNAVSALALDGGNLWVGGLGYLALLDLKQDKTLRYARLPVRVVNHIQIGGGYVWAQCDSCLYRAPIQ